MIVHHFHHLLHLLSVIGGYCPIKVALTKGKNTWVYHRLHWKYMEYHFQLWGVWDNVQGYPWEVDIGLIFKINVLIRRIYTWICKWDCCHHIVWAWNGTLCNHKHYIVCQHYIVSQMNWIFQVWSLLVQLIKMHQYQCQ